jgi:penicillin-binding protein 1C
MLKFIHRLPFIAVSTAYPKSIELPVTRHPSLVTGFLSLLLAFLLVQSNTLHAEIPSFGTVKAAWQSTEGLLLDRHGVPIHEMRVIEKGRRLAWIQLSEISQVALSTIVRAEDKRFYRHAGVDWLALSDAALDTLLFSKPRGASTISMQVAAHLDASLRPTGRKRSVSQKWDQIGAAHALEKNWSKSQILETYLNLATFRGELQGIGAASRALFAKKPDGLDERESLLLAVMLRGPNARNDATANRACVLARGMKSTVTCPELETLVSTLPAVPTIAPRVALAPHLARELLSPENPRVQTTLDGALQAFALEALQGQLAQLSRSQVADGAVLVADNRSGEVLAYIGNTGASASAFYVDGVRAPRQAGSTLKPFLYHAAIEARLLTAASLMDDSPVNLITPSGLYVPQNYDRDFKGMISVRTALSSSLNVPAVRTLMLLGADNFAERLRALGFSEVTGDGNFYGYSLALGSAEVSLWQLANAYRTLANGGRVSALTLKRGVRNPLQPLLDPAASWIVANMLSDPLARSLAFGLESPLASRHWAAVKTGTSKDMRDNWCVGFTDQFTVAVWVGNFDGGPMHDVSGVTGAAPVWLELVNYLHRGSTSVAPAPPLGVVATQVDFGNAVEPARAEYFLAGTETGRMGAKPAATSMARIAYPGNGSVLALDPDIPMEVQRVRLVVLPSRTGYRWHLNGEYLGPSGEPIFWVPQPGHHWLALLDGAGVEVDRVQFEVRGSTSDKGAEE